ncbi:MAG: sulfotransferase [Myxococcales bacterium]|nr:MAG: sulfotransferase [Myxococcales bacterium]
MLTPPTLPLGARLVNHAGRLAGRLGVGAHSLDESALLDQASRNTGLADFGLATFLEGLRALLDSLKRDARLTPIGRMIARGDIVMLLENRLGIIDWHKRYPEIGEQPIERPVIVIGMARTGTTILHHLIGLDPDARVPMTWECDRPCPPPCRATFESDPRIAESQKQIDRSESLIPDFKKMHPMGAQLSQECVRMTATEFASMIFQPTYRIPGYNRWLHADCDLAHAYRMHRKFLQLLQWRCPGKRWFLKTPGHLWALEAVLAEYPDACFVQTHRDPLKIMSSLTSLCTTLRAMTSEPVDPLEIAHEWSDYNARAYDLSVDARRSGLIPPERVVDVQFRDYLADPVGIVRKIYDKFDVELTDQAERRMRAHLDSNPVDKHGKHVHTFEDTGLELTEEREKVRRYQEYFGVESEV